MKDFDNSLITQIASEEATVFWLFEFKVSPSLSYYYSTFDINIVYDGNTYIPYAFEIKPVSSSGDLSVDRVNLLFSNVDLAFSSILLSNNVQGHESVISFGVLDSGTIRVEEIYRGITNEWGLDEKEASISIVSEFVYWNKKTLRKPGALCPWVFKGTECGYTGDATECNKTYERCDYLGNTDNFGGFRFFPSIEEKEIWWGKTTPPSGNGGGNPFNGIFD